MKHKPYLSYFEPITGMQTWRCDNCDAQVHLGVFQLEDEECPNTGAPDWKSIDAEERRRGFERMMERSRGQRNFMAEMLNEPPPPPPPPEPKVLRCDSCGVTFDGNTEVGRDGYWSHCCQPGSWDT